jgi:hypothetical protein
MVPSDRISADFVAKLGRPQVVLSSKLFKTRSQTFKQRLSGLDLARLESVSGPHSGDFLHVVPSSALGFMMGSAEYSASLRMRLGLPAKKTDGRLCPACRRVQISLRGEHCLTCSSDRDHIGGHNTMRDLIHASMRDALLNHIKEPLYLVAGSQQHPDINVPAWTMTRMARQQQTSWDAQCSSSG